MKEFLFVLVIAAVVAFWVTAMRAREAALRYANNACKQNGVLLLDQTVAMFRLGVGRDRTGRLRWRRLYRFEFTREGEERRTGELELLGDRLLGVNLYLPGHTVIDENSESE